MLAKRDANRSNLQTSAGIVDAERHDMHSCILYIFQRGRQEVHGHIWPLSSRKESARFVYSVGTQ
jgi:hypothetical protein